MTQETIEKLHELESKRSSLQEQMDSFTKVMGLNRDDLMVDVTAMGWHSGERVLRFHKMPQEVMDALRLVMNRTAKELSDVNKAIEAL